jgi:cytoskeletal protein CcmA (bactofilin family)
LPHMTAWIFQITGTLSLAAGVKTILSGGALASNIVWVVAESVTLGAQSHLEGVVLGKISITLETGSSINGRLLSQTNVALQSVSCSSRFSKNDADFHLCRLLS